MKHEKLSEAMNEISDRHIAEAANAKKKRRPYWIGGLAAALALVILAAVLINPLAIRAEAVSTADYPKYEWKIRPEIREEQALLASFFGSSISTTLSGTGGENQAYSPINLYMALALTAELTGGNSRQQLFPGDPLSPQKGGEACSGEKEQQIEGSGLGLRPAQGAGEPEHQQAPAANPQPGENAKNGADGNGGSTLHRFRMPPQRMKIPKIRCSQSTGIFLPKMPARNPPAALPAR